MTVQEAVRAYRIVIEKTYAESLKRLFDTAVKKLGPTLKGIYNDPVYARMTGTLMSVTKRVVDKNKSVLNIGELPYEIDSEKLKKASAIYADAAETDLLAKLMKKISDLDDASVQEWTANSFTIYAWWNGKFVRIEQSMILNFSSRGKPFNQWPALIYVDGKRISEAAFAKMRKEESQK